MKSSVFRTFLPRGFFRVLWLNFSTVVYIRLPVKHALLMVLEDRNGNRMRPYNALLTMYGTDGTIRSFKF